MARFSRDEIRHLYDFPSHFLNLNGLRYHYLDEGGGEPLILLHGNPSWSFMYRELIRGLRDAYRLVAPDHMGCGLSDKPENGRYSYRLVQRVQDLALLLEHLGLSRDITLVMHDWGGPIGMAYAVRHPTRVRRLIVLNTAAFLPPGKELHWLLRWCSKSRLAGFLIRRLNLFTRVATRLGCRRRAMLEDVRRGYIGPYDSWENSIATVRFVQDIPLTVEHPSYRVLQEMQEKLWQFKETPILICWGEKDFVFDRDFLEEWRRRFPQARICSFAEAGHYVLEDVPELVVPAVRQFLSQHPLTS